MVLIGCTLVRAAGEATINLSTCMMAVSPWLIDFIDVSPPAHERQCITGHQTSGRCIVVVFLPSLVVVTDSLHRLMSSDDYTATARLCNG